MTKKSKKVILWVVGIFIASNLLFGGVSLLFENYRDSETDSDQLVAIDTTAIDPAEASSIIGRWRLTSELAPKLNSTIVIYLSGDKYYYKETYDTGSDKTAELRKEDNKYYDLDSSHDEYFQVEEDGSMRMFDSEGEYGNGNGYSIIPLK